MHWSLIALLILGALVATALVLLYTVGRQPVKRRAQTLAAYERSFVQLASLMSEGTLFVIEHEQSQRFLQFKRVPGGVLFGLPNAPWSRRYFEDVVAALADTHHRVYRLATGSEPTTEFVQLELQGHPDDIGREAVLIAQLSARAMGVLEPAAWRGYYQGDFDPRAYLAHVEPQYEKMASEGPLLQRKFFRRHLATLRRAAGRKAPPD